jgi:predicted MPP superfamily phosphohydrolase
MIFLLLIYGLPVLGVLWWIWADRSVRKMKRARWWRIGVGAWMAMMVGGYIWLLVTRRFHIGALPPVAIQSAVYIWHLLMMPMMLVMAAVVGIYFATARGIRKFKPAPSPVGTSRREMLGAVVAGVPPLVTAGMVAVALPQLSKFRVRQIDVPVAGLPSALEGMTIAHITDVHVGKYTKGAVLDAIVERTNALKADLVLMTGDLIDWSMNDLPAAIEMMKGFRTASGGGAIMCEGNHDLFDDRLGFERGVKDAGVHLLLNESEIVRVRGQKVQILGIKWGGMSADRRDAGISAHVNAVAELRDDDALPILLAHHPHSFDAAAARGIPLTLAGHTHGGQLMLRGIGAGPFLFKYWSGLYRDLGASLVVSNGVGNWFPLRIGAPAEVLHLRLMRG